MLTPREHQALRPLAGIALLTASVYVVSVAWADLCCWLADRGDEPGDREVW